MYPVVGFLKLVSARWLALARLGLITSKKNNGQKFLPALKVL